MGLTRPSKSSSASPLHMVPKKESQWRACDDYMRLNSRNISDKYPVPLPRDFTHALYGKKVFSTIDLSFCLDSATQHSIVPLFMDEVLRGLDFLG